MTGMKPAIHFYSTGGEYGCFSNFYRSPIQLDGATWPTTEHYFQAQKFVDAAIQASIRRASTPSQAARMGRDRNNPLRRDWENVKVDVMRRAVLAKFTQHDDLWAILLGTGDATIVEHTEKDSYWGDGGDGSGKNMLGRILMEVRAKLQSQPSALDAKSVFSTDTIADSTQYSA